MKQNNYNKKSGSIGITIVMLVFAFMMSVSMAYHKQIQTETTIRKQVDYSDRAVDAAFSGINYAIATIQSNKNVFKDKYITFKNVAEGTQTTSDIINISQPEWMCLDKNLTFSNYYDERNDNKPPYRFIVGCTEDSYDNDKNTILIKSIGEYIQYSEEDKIASFTAELIAECIKDKQAKTIRINRYKKIETDLSSICVFKDSNRKITFEKAQ